jgi:hypothetical protein
MRRGMCARARRRAARHPQARPSNGGFTFAEDPCVGAPDARVLWSHALDPGILAVTIVPVAPDDDDAVALGELAPWLTVVDGIAGCEHAVLSDGWRRVRLDVHGGSLRSGGTVRFRYELGGISSLEPKLLPLRRLISFCRAHRFAATLFPTDRKLRRWIECLRVADARVSGASYREIAVVLFGEKRTRAEWQEGGRSLHSRVRRLAATGQFMSAGGYRHLLRTSRDFPPRKITNTHGE